MSGTAGSANLDSDQQTEIQKLFGQRYTTVQTNSSVPSRSERRAHERFLRRRPDRGRLYGVPRG